MEITSTELGLAARVQHLTKTYGTGEGAVRALDGVSVGIRRGQFTAIMGPSGSGKSTLMHIMGRCKRQRPRSRTGTLADFAHGGGNIAGSLDALERRAHFRKNPCPGGTSYHVRCRPARSAGCAHGRFDPGDNVDNRWCHATV